MAYLNQIPESAAKLRGKPRYIVSGYVAHLNDFAIFGFNAPSIRGAMTASP
jgi:hypothetical protein